jgi:hypothetical protein
MLPILPLLPILQEKVTNNLGLGTSTQITVSHSNYLLDYHILTDIQIYM